jgi:hypothetical protein
MRIRQAGHQDAAAAVDHSGVRAHAGVGPNACDHVVFDQHIGGAGQLQIDAVKDANILDQRLFRLRRFLGCA